MPFDNDKLIDQDTGKIDMAEVRERATLTACREYGGHQPPPNYLRSAERAVMDLALAVRANWLRDHGLPEDGETIIADTSGYIDSFRRAS